jgi:hypothetical protein
MPDKPKAPSVTMTDYVNAALDAGYKRSAVPMLKQIQSLTNGSSIQRALSDLDTEAKRLQDAGQKMDPQNPVLRIAMIEFQKVMAATAQLVLANEKNIQASGQTIAVPAFVAKVLPGLGQQAVKYKMDPTSPQALKMYKELMK